MEGVFHVAGIIEPAPADVQDHRAMPRDQFGKGDLVAIGQEPLQELPLAKPGERPTLEHYREMSEQMTRALTRHAGRSATAVPITTKVAHDFSIWIDQSPKIRTFCPFLYKSGTNLGKLDKGTRA
jgi:hypothetical protein